MNNLILGKFALEKFYYSTLPFWLTPLGYRDRFYEEFLWGLNEHKEMLIAMAMLLYALYRLPHLKWIRSRS
ncbi:MAG: hypothetical protein R3B95_01015 [Nitrospirales bacterium]|nr:hypothetical protein [Nitrospirales bacterium]